MKRLTKKQWQRRRRRKQCILLLLKTAIATLLICTVITIFTGNFKEFAHTVLGISFSTKTIAGVNITEMLLTPNEYSRPQTSLKHVNSIVIHYVGNPGTTAQGNRNYFEGLAEKKEYYASSHYVIGLEGEIIQCIPLNEISYASNDRNNDTISIECCHPDETGEFNEATYESLIKLTAMLSCKYDLRENDIIRHYDVTGKQCPLYYVEHEKAWKKLKKDVMNYIDENAVTVKN